MPSGTSQVVTESQLLEILLAAMSAPSSHNSQPWQFRLSPDRILLYADRSRRLPVNDPRDRELTISCGAALLNMRIAAHRANLRLEVETLPVESESDLLARVTLHRSDDSHPDAQLFDAISRRRTVRKRFRGEAPPPLAAERLAEAAAREAAKLIMIVDDREKERIAELVAEGDRAQFSNKAWRRELASWMRPVRAGDGLPVPALLAPAVRMAIRRLNLGRRIARADEKLILSAPLLAVLCCDEDTAEGWLRSGQALERVLLTAVQLGLQVGFLNQPCQVEPIRPRLTELLDDAGHPQAILRFGFVDGALPRSPRRRVGDAVQGWPEHEGREHLHSL